MSEQNNYKKYELFGPSILFISTAMFDLYLPQLDILFFCGLASITFGLAAIAVNSCQKHIPNLILVYIGSIALLGYMNNLYNENNLTQYFNLTVVIFGILQILLALYLFMKTKNEQGS